MQDETQFTIQLDGLAQDDANLRLDGFVDELKFLLAALDASEKAVGYEGGDNEVVYRIMGLSRNSPILISLQAIALTTDLFDDPARRVLNYFFDCLNKLHQGDNQGLENNFVKAIKGMANGIDSRFSKITISGKGTSFEIDRRMQGNISQIISVIHSEQRVISSWGTIKGHVERYNSHGGRKYFWLYPMLGGCVKCEFPDNLKDEAVFAVERNVSVTGMMTYKPEQPMPNECYVESIEIHDPDDQLPELQIGQFPEITGNKSGAQYIQGLRDDWD